MKKPAIVFAAVLIASGLVHGEGDDTPSDMIRKIESEIVRDIQIGPGPTVSLAERLKALKVPGLSIAVVKDFAVHWAKGYGVRDARSGEPVTEGTLFQAASITKSISAAVTLRLVQDGVLDLDEDVNRYLKRWRVPDNEFTRIEKVTLRRILSHTAGFTVSGMPSYAEGQPVPTILQVLEGLPPAANPPVKVDRLPGSEFRYSGGGYTVLQVLLEDVTGRPLPELASEYIFKPAGMTRSVICLCNAPAWAGQAASGHGREGAPFKGQAFLVGGSGCCELWTTASDLARYIIAIQRSLRGDAGAILSRRTARTMMTLEREGGRGLGLVVRRYGDAVYIGHDGANVGFLGRVLCHPEKGYGMAFLINTDAAGGLIDELTMTIARAYDWDGIKPERYKDAAAFIEETRRLWAAPDRRERSESGLSRLGYFLDRRGYPDSALDVYRLNVEINPRSAAAAARLAEGYESRGDAAKALEYYRKSVGLLDRYPDANAGFVSSRAATTEKIRDLERRKET